MLRSNSMTLRLLASAAMAACLTAQPKPNPDVLLFVDGEKLVGQLKSATDKEVVFKSDMGFEVTVPWAKIQELHSANKFAAIHKDFTLRNSEDAAHVAQGTLEMTNQKLAVSPAPPAQPQTIAVNEVSNVVEQASFEHALHHQGLFEGWKGTGAFGLALTESTVSNQTVTSAINLSRSDPSESWLRTRNRTTFTFNSAYGKVTQAGSPDLKISLYHADLLHDFYFKPRWSVFVGASFDHNLSQGLDLLQSYGGGLGAVLYKTEHSELDARAGINFLHQMYADDPSLNRNLIGSRFNETFTHTFARGIVLNEEAGFRPSWNDLKEYYTGFFLALNVPVYRRLGLQMSTYDSYVNDPPPGFKKNSYQLTIGATYTLK